jgi:hypothetical protein
LRHTSWIRVLTPPKSNTYTENLYVDATGISRKEICITQEICIRVQQVPDAIGEPEVSRGIVGLREAEGPNKKRRMET